MAKEKAAMAKEKAAKESVVKRDAKTRARLQRAEVRNEISQSPVGQLFNTLGNVVLVSTVGAVAFFTLSERQYGTAIGSNVDVTDHVTDKPHTPTGEDGGEPNKD